MEYTNQLLSADDPAMAMQGWHQKNRKIENKDNFNYQNFLGCKSRSRKTLFFLNPVTFGVVKTPMSFGHSGYNRVKNFNIFLSQKSIMMPL